MKMHKLMEHKVRLFLESDNEGYVDDVSLIEALDNIVESDEIEIIIKKNPNRNLDSSIVTSKYL